ncbi:MAG: ATP-binding cassette domain-containing protein [Hyphomicrobiaceae bacterium]|nr:ATP-binding cassette domain-containing protein [Hyphomicrobiaceae bacterium]
MRRRDLAIARQRGSMIARRAQFDDRAPSASGGGKTTLLRLIAGLERCTSGTIKINGARSIGSTEQVAIVFQDPTLLPWRTVLEN